MVADIGNIIVNSLVSLPFIDKYAGCVRIGQYKDKDKVKKFPISCATSADACEGPNSRYLDLCPDDTKKSVLYLEENFLRVSKREGNYIYFEGSFDLVCWINMPKLGYTDCSYSATAILGIMKKLGVKPFNESVYSLIKIDVAGQRPKNINPFSKYTYDETITQFLLYPYDFFVLTLNVSFRCDLRCLQVTPIGVPLNCLPPVPIKYAIIKDQNGNVVTTLNPGEVYTIEILQEIIQTLTDPPPVNIIQIIT